MTPKDTPRLYAAGLVYAFPFVELICIPIGWLMLATAASEYADQDLYGFTLLNAGIVHGLVGWPLLFARVNVFWFDVFYLLLGIFSIIYFAKWSGPEMTTLGLGTLAFGPGLALAGLSYSIRRAVAFFLNVKDA